MDLERVEENIDWFAEKGTVNVGDYRIGEQEIKGFREALKHRRGEYDPNNEKDPLYAEHKRLVLNMDFEILEKLRAEHQKVIDAVKMRDVSQK